MSRVFFYLQRSRVLQLRRGFLLFFYLQRSCGFVICKESRFCNLQRVAFLGIFCLQRSRGIFFCNVFAVFFDLPYNLHTHQTICILAPFGKIKYHCSICDHVFSQIGTNTTFLSGSCITISLPMK